MSNKLDAFKAKADSILLNDALLNVTGGALDAEDCHPEADGGHRNKIAAGYTNQQVEYFFSNTQWSSTFLSMYRQGDMALAERRMNYFDSIVSTIG